MVGHAVRGSDGCSGGLEHHGGCDASAARGNVRGVSLGVGGGGCNGEMEKMVEGEEFGL